VDGEAESTCRGEEMTNTEIVMLLVLVGNLVLFYVMHREIKELRDDSKNTTDHLEHKKAAQYDLNCLERQFSVYRNRFDVLTDELGYTFETPECKMKAVKK
jgi:hypothetical protein